MRLITWLKLKENQILLCLLLFTVAVRVPYPLTNSFAFSFDHGKDSMAVMHMLTTLSPKFVGPWTSIPGLFFGPGWYYFLAPFYALGGFHPASGVYAMIMLLVAVVTLAYKKIGKFEAVVFATAPLWMTVSTSAWNPFPMVATSLVVAVILMSVRKKQEIPWRKSGLLGFVSALGFHFSSAFAIFYIPIILLSLLYQRSKFSVRTWLGFIGGGVIPFVPQILFELKNNLSQTRGVWEYFTTSRESDAFSMAKITELVSGVLDTLRFAILPEFRFPDPTNTLVLKGVFLLALLITMAWSVRMKVYKKYQDELVLCAIFIFVPVIGLSFLHYNGWYLLGFAPSAVILFGILCKSLPKLALRAWAMMFLLTPITFVYTDLLSPDSEFLQSKVLLRNKEKAISLIRSDAGSRSFAVYHYEPSIYDFSYQYLYLQQGFRGKPLPHDFAYLPDQPVYIVEKQEILQNLSQPDATEFSPTYYLVEKPIHQQYLHDWWNALGNPQVDQIGNVADGITIYRRSPGP